MPDIEVTIDLYCSCGHHMCSNGTSGSRHGRPCFTIEPCPDCLENAKAEGDRDGYERGLEDGRREAESEKGA